MTEARPEISCSDYWPEGIPQYKLAVYEAMIRAGQITKPRCIVSRSAGSCLVTYMSAIPHEWLLQEMQQLADTMNTRQEVMAL